jgi:hypothetical protein
LPRRHDGAAALVRALFGDDHDPHVLEGDWGVVLPPHARFDLIFRRRWWREGRPDAVLSVATPGATLAVDDVSAGWAGRVPRVASGGSAIPVSPPSRSGPARLRSRSCHGPQLTIRRTADPSAGLRA